MTVEYMKAPQILRDFNITRLPRQAAESIYSSVNAVLAQQYRFEQKMSAQPTAWDSLSKAQTLRGRMVDNVYRKLSMGDIDSRPIAYAAVELAERFGPAVIKIMSKGATNPAVMFPLMAVTLAFTDEATRSMLTEQVTNFVSIFNSQVHDAEDQVSAHSHASSHSEMPAKDNGPL